MLAPLSWLRKYIDVEIPAEELADRMTMTGSEVEGVQKMGENIQDVLVGKIMEMSPHPNADRLRVCMVDVGKENLLQIVTGADNVFEGALVPIAMIGCLLPTGLKIKKGKLRGMLSEGMMCSGEELEIGDDVYPGASVNGIIIIKEEYAPGTDIKKVLGMDDMIIDFKTYANRPDCLSIIGLAREAAATLDTPLRFPETSYKEGGEKTADHVAVEVQDAELCPRYMGRLVTDINIAPSPDWMQKELTAAGVRPINNIVDITNYVMLELGQPMHAFDFKYVKEGKIVVRRAKAGETLTTLDGDEKELTEDMLVIADTEKPVALAGIMGGEHSGVYDDTQMVLFESANFRPQNVRMTSRAVGLRTESSARFEKGLDPANAETALDRAMHLVELLGAGKVAKGCVDVCNADVSEKDIEVKVGDVNHLLGQNLTGKEMASILERVFIETKVKGDTLVCSIPTYRKDIEHSADIAEEVIRIYGYDKIPSIMPEMHISSAGLTPKQKTMKAIRNMMVGMGLYEATHYSFMSPSDLDKLGVSEDDALRQVIRLMNPMGEDYSLMRTTMVPAMLTSISNNVNRNNNRVHLFEMSRTFHKVEGAEMPEEVNRMCVGILAKGEDFFSIKGKLELLFDMLRVEAEYAAVEISYMHPGRTAGIVIDGEPVGYVGEIHPDAAANYSIKGKAYVAEIDLDKLVEARIDNMTVKPLPKYPAVERDLAVVMDEEQAVGPILGAIRKVGGDLIEQASVFDIYQGKQVEEGKKSVAFSLVFRSIDRTLTDDEVSRRFNKIVRTLDNQYGAKLRQ